MATPSPIQDPRFAFTVVFVLEHNEEGALGVVLTQPSKLPVTDTFDRWVDVVASPEVLFRGGPVALSSVIAVGVAAESPAPGWNPIQGSIGTVDLDLDPEAIPELRGCRLFGGYAGWTPGQLEAELANEAWFVVDANPDDLLDNDPQNLWWRVLGRQESKLQMLRHYPKQPWLN